MITTIYNLFNIIILTILYCTGHNLMLYWYFFIISYASIVITHSVSKIINNYPNISKDQVEAIDFLYYKNYGINSATVIGSGIIYTMIFGFYLGNMPVLLCVAALTTYRFSMCRKGFVKVRDNLK